MSVTISQTSKICAMCLRKQQRCVTDLNDYKPRMSATAGQVRVLQKCGASRSGVKVVCTLFQSSLGTMEVPDDAQSVSAHSHLSHVSQLHKFRALPKTKSFPTSVIGTLPLSLESSGYEPTALTS
eukprot:4005897-Amphidinium_carterae.1